MEKRTFEKECLWIYGEPGTGKSNYAREKDFDNTYFKDANKWWDGYAGQSIVVFDDLGEEEAQCLKNKFKRWADPWGNYTGEIKGGCVPLKFDTLIVTSNFSLEECFTGITLRAMKRRFK